MGYMRSIRVYEPTYTVNNPYNDLIILQDVFLTRALRYFYIFTCNLVLLTSYCL